jgi:8-oxo-dGTP diphosphatase
MRQWQAMRLARAATIAGPVFAIAAPRDLWICLGPAASCARDDRLVNRFVRFSYRCVFAAARVWWFLRRPRTTGAMVAIWSGERFLLVRSSYRSRRYSLPGGFVRRGEAPHDAALRELAEELGFTIQPAALRLAWEGSLHFEWREDAITIWEARLESPAPAIRIDEREIVWAGWKTRAEADTLDLLPSVRTYLRSLG